jgi:hypothetical protein
MPNLCLVGEAPRKTVRDTQTVPTALGILFVVFLFPALAGWANTGRASDGKNKVGLLRSE